MKATEKQENPILQFKKHEIGGKATNYVQAYKTCHSYARFI